MLFQVTQDVNLKPNSRRTLPFFGFLVPEKGQNGKNGIRRQKIVGKHKEYG